MDLFGPFLFMACNTVTSPGQSGTFADRQVKATNCMVCFPAQCVCHQVQSRFPYFGQAGYLIQTDLFHEPTSWEV